MIDYNHPTIAIGTRMMLCGQLLEVVKQNSCTGCYFGNCPDKCRARVKDFAVVGKCSRTRTDHTNVIFKPVKE